MNATFAAGSTLAGDIGLVTQSGGIAIGVQEELRRLGLGLSNLVSTGDKLDISSNDLLMWWEHDQETRIVVLYLESFGNPRKFSRLARRVAARKPVLAIHSATSEAGQRAAASHTASTATPSVTRDALFRQAGVLVGVVTDEKFGPLVVAGLGGVDTDLVDDRTAALAPLSTADADDLLHGFPFRAE